MFTEIKHLIEELITFLSNFGSEYRSEPSIVPLIFELTQNEN